MQNKDPPALNGHMEGLSLQGMTVHGAQGVQGAAQNAENPAEPMQKPRRVSLKLQALVYDTLPSTTAVFNYAVGSRELSANEQFFVSAHTVVSLLQTTRIKQGMSFVAANKVYTSTNKTTIV